MINFILFVFFSKKLNKAQRGYGITDKEALALVLAVRAFRVYMSGTTVVYSDHEALRYIHGSASKNQRLMRWSLELQPYDIKVEHIKGCDNVVADYLSRHVDMRDKAVTNNLKVSDKSVSSTESVVKKMLLVFEGND